MQVVIHETPVEVPLIVAVPAVEEPLERSGDQAIAATQLLNAA